MNYVSLMFKIYLGVKTRISIMIHQLPISQNIVYIVYCQ